MDSKRAVFDDSVKAEKANAMRRYRWRQNLRWFFKACVPLAPLSYALCRDVDTPRQLLIAVFNSNLCVFLLLNALVAMTCFLSSDNNVSGNNKKVSKPDIYGEYAETVKNKDPKQGGCFVSGRNTVAVIETKTTTSPEKESNLNVNVDPFVPVCEDKALNESQIVVYPVTESETVKIYRRTQSETRKTVTSKRSLERSVTEMHRKSKPENVSSVEDLSAEEFQRQVENFIKTRKMIQRLEKVERINRSIAIY